MPLSIDAAPARLERWRADLVPSLREAFLVSEASIRAWMPSAAAEQTDAEGFVSWCIAAFDEGTSFAYAMVEEREVIGYCNLAPRGDWAEVAYWVRIDRSGGGRATAAVRALVGAAFDSLPKVKRLEIHCDQANHASRRVAEKAGFHRVGASTRIPRTTSESDTELVFAVSRQRAADTART